MIYLAWVGQNAIIGTPNRITGYCNKFGTLHAFISKAERDAFCDRWNDQHNSYPVPVNRKTARKYFLGMTVRDYLDHVNVVECYPCDTGGDYDF